MTTLDAPDTSSAATDIPHRRLSGGEPHERGRAGGRGRWQLAMDDVAAGRAPARLAELRGRLSPRAEVIASPAERAIYARDLAELPPPMVALFEMTPQVVVQPATARDVAEAVRWAHARRIPVTPRGLASSAYGGAVPARGGLVIDTLRMHAIGRVDPTRRTVELQAGVNWGDLDAYLAKHNLEPATCPSSRFSTVGGWVSTGGYGLNALGGGHFSNWVESLTVVLPDGTLTRLAPADPAFARYFGTEGQFGVVTDLTLRLRPRTLARPHLLDFDSLRAAQNFVRDLLTAGHAPDTARLLDAAHMANLNRLHAEEHPGATLVEERDAVLLTFATSEASEAFLEWVEEKNNAGVQHPGLADRAIASALWQRRFFSMKIKRLGPSLLAAQLVLPFDETASFVEDVATLARRFGLPVETEVYLLTGDQLPVTSDQSSVNSNQLPITDRQLPISNLQSLVMPAFPCDSRHPAYPLHLAFVQMVTRLGIKRGGRPYSAGLLNGSFAREKFGGRYEDLLAAKKELDPDGLFNPGKFPAVQTRFGALTDLLFQPTLFRLTMDALLALSPLVGLAARVLNRFGPTPVPVPRADRCNPVALDDARLQEAIQSCTACGDCLPVCPAYLVTGDETVVGRHKLRTGLKLLRGEPVGRLESDKTFLCMYCSACQDVCQASLPLISMYGKIEEKLAALHGRPDDLIADFIHRAESMPEFHDFVGASTYPHPEPEIPSAPEPPLPSPATSHQLPVTSYQLPVTNLQSPITNTHSTSKYHIETALAPHRTTPPGQFLVTREDWCINCGQCVRACIYGVHFRSPDDLRKMAAPDSHLCRNCFRCIQECPRLALAMNHNPAYEEQGRGVYTPDVVTSLVQQAEKGAIPVLGQGYRGAFSGPGFDGIWTDMSEIVRPTRDGIHGREYISTAIDLGRRPERLEFGPDGRLLTRLSPILELPIPLIFGHLPGQRPAVIRAVLAAAARLGTLAELTPQDWAGLQEEYRRFAPALTLRVSPDGLRDPHGPVSLARMLILEPGAFPWLDGISLARRANPSALIAVALPFGPAAPSRAVEMAASGQVDLIRLEGDNGTLPNRVPALPAGLPAVHEALVEAGLRDRITLIASGGIAMAEHLPKAIILGADGVAIDWPLAIALECRLHSEACLQGACDCGLETVPPEWGEQRIVNLMAAWRNQVLEVLGAMGLREARRLRGERGRAMFAEELEEQYFKPLMPGLSPEHQTLVPIPNLQLPTTDC